MNRRVVPDRDLVVDGEDVELALNPSRSTFAREFYQSGTNVNEADFDRLFRQLCFDGMTYVDVGAHLGYYSVLAATRCETAEVVAFEPEPENATFLERNAELNGVDLRVERAVASDDPGRQQWDADDDLESGSIATTRREASESVRSVRLDDYLDEVGVDHVDLLKIDVEGAEGLVLDGLGEALGRVDAIALELHTQQTASYGHEPTAILETLFQLSDTLYHVDNNGSVAAVTRAQIESGDAYDRFEMSPATVHIVLAVRDSSRVAEQLPASLRSVRA